MISVLHVRLAQKVAAEKKPSSDLLLIVEKTKHVFSIERCIPTERQAEPKPGRLTVCCGDRQQKNIFEMLKAIPQIFPIASTCLNEFIQPFKLGEPDRGLHVGNLQIIAEVRVDIFVIISERQFSELPAKPLLASVVLARVAVTIPSPIADRFDNSHEDGGIAEDGAALPHRDMVRGIE